MSLATYAQLIAIVGLGMNALTNIAIPSTLGGSFYQNTVPNDRIFTIIAFMTGGGDYAVIQAKRKALINAIKPDLVTKKQPMIIQYDQLDANGLEISETLMIPALYQGGLEGDGSENAAFEKVAIDFTSYLYIAQDGEHGTILGFQSSVANANYIIMRTAAGVWQALATGTDDSVYSLAIAPDGSLYIGGNFTNLGDANGDRISKWNGTGFSSLGTGANNDASSLVVAPDGTLYAGGNFTLMGGVANTVHIAKWDGANWTPLLTGANAAVNALAIGPDGYLYVGGDFTNLGDASGDHIVKWTGAAWVSLGTGANGGVNTIAFDYAGNLYAGGSFTSIGGITATGIAKWDGANWSALASTGIAGAGTPAVYSIVRAIGGGLFVGGDFTSIGGITANYIAYWNGISYIPLASGTNAMVTNMVIGPDANLYVFGGFTVAGGVSLTNVGAVWNGSAWLPIDINLPVGQIWAGVFDRSGDLYLGIGGSGTAYSATITAPNVGSATAYPVVAFNGPGTCYQLKNYTTGKSIYFKLTLISGETAILNLDPHNISFTSSSRGNIISTILPGSDLSWELLPGNNNVSTFMYGSTSGATAIAMTWKDQYHSIDGAVR